MASTTTNYSDFDANAYVDDASFRAWVWQQSDVATLFWERFVLEYPHKAPEISQAKAMVLGMTIVQEPMDADEIETRIQATLTRIHPLPVALPAGWHPDSAPVRRLWPLRWMAAAASVVLLLGVGWGWFVAVDHPAALVSRGANRPAVALTKQVNNTNQPRRLVLSDRSVVILQPNSQLRYPEMFGGIRREVYLTGEARFEVTRHPDQPFFVYAQNVVTKVLGTSFTVRAFANERSVQVLVKTGRVAVYANPDASTTDRTGTKGILLTPNQQVSYSRISNDLTRTLVAKPELLPTVAPSTVFVYDETPVADVLTALERAYSVPIIFDEADLSKCLLTATLNKQSFYTKLDLICQAIGGRYEVVDGQVVIVNAGCR